MENYFYGENKDIFSNRSNLSLCFIYFKIELFNSKFNVEISLIFN